jgi:predicted DNA-binding transcriptional regulator YafY
MPAEDRTRLSRLTAILVLLQSRKRVTATQLAQKFDISVRTVYRDIKALENAGIPVLTEEGKGYTLMEGYTLPPVMFTETEANALVTVEQLVLKNKDASLVRDYKDAVTRVKAVLRHSLKNRSELLAQRIVSRLNPGETRTSNHLSALQLALTHFKVVKMCYCSLEDDTITNRIIEPFALYSTRENWILIAWCRLRKDFRSFRLDRIQQVQTLDEHFSPHKLTLQEYFELCRRV